MRDTDVVPDRHAGLPAGRLCFSCVLWSLYNPQQRDEEREKKAADESMVFLSSSFGSNDNLFFIPRGRTTRELPCNYPSFVFRRKREKRRNRGTPR